MSMRFAVALAATLGAGILMSDAAAARPELVGMHGTEYSPGTIAVKTGERRLYLILDHDRRQISPSGLVAARRGEARQAEHARRHSRRLAAQSDGRRGDDIVRRRICHSRHQRTELRRRLRLLWLHPHAERRHHRSLF